MAPSSLDSSSLLDSKGSSPEGNSGSEIVWRYSLPGLPRRIASGAFSSSRFSLLLAKTASPFRSVVTGPAALSPTCNNSACTPDTGCPSFMLVTRNIRPEGVSTSVTTQSLREIMERLPTGRPLRSFPEISTRYTPGSVVCGFHCSWRGVSLSSPLASTFPEATD